MTREQVTERLAAALWLIEQRELSLRDLDDGTVSAADVEARISRHLSLASWVNVRAAERLLDTLGLIALDPALVERVKDAPPAADDPYDQTGQPYHSADAPDCGIDGTCLRCQVRLDCREHPEIGRACAQATLNAALLA